MKNKKGITLIALVITIIILIILAGVAIYLSLGNNGILNKTDQAKEEYLNAQALEQEKINDLYSQMLIATNDSSQITISMEDLNTLIDTKLEQKIQSMNIGFDIIFDFDENNSNKCANKEGTYTLNIGTGKSSVDDYNHIIVFSQLADGSCEASNIIYNMTDEKITKKNYSSTTYPGKHYQYTNSMMLEDNWSYNIRYTFNETSLIIDDVHVKGWSTAPRINKIIAFY